MARMARNADGVGAWARGAGRRSPGLLIKEAGLIGASLDPLSKRAGLIGGPWDLLSKNIGFMTHLRGDFLGPCCKLAYTHLCTQGLAVADRSAGGSIWFHSECTWINLQLVPNTE